MVARGPNSIDPAQDVPAQGKPCPICGNPALAATRPFCSRRCADVDLHRWLGGVYRVPVEADTEEDDIGDATPVGRPGEPA